MNWYENTNVSVAGTPYHTIPLNMHSPTLVSGESVFTGNLVGTFFIEVSVTGNQWYRVSNGDQAVAAPQNHLIEIVGNTTPLVRFGFDVLSGTGTWTVNAFNKEG